MPLSALTLLIGWQEGYPACKKTDWFYFSGTGSPGSPGEKAVKWVCVCVCVCVCACVYEWVTYGPLCTFSHILNISLPAARTGVTNGWGQLPRAQQARGAKQPHPKYFITNEHKN